ncbi:hypothetical protein JZU46_06755, partial [bacterium]|nr:hypothetical protein [bacterium]
SFDYVQAELDIATMVTTLGHNKFVVLTALNGEYSDRYIGTTGYNQMMIFNNWIAATYPDNYIDIRTYLVSQYNASIPQDVIDHGHDIHPSSLRIDTIHLNLTGNTLVAIQVFNLLEPARTNFTTAYGLNDIVSLNGAPTGMTKSGNSTATLKVSSQSTFINSLFGLGPVAQTYNKCYEFDNSLGGSGDAIVTIDGASATSPQSYSVYAQVLTGSATLQNDSAEGAVVFNNALPAIVKSENVIVAGSRKLQIVVPIGCKIYFCLEVGTKCTSFMATYGATAARAATTATLPIPATSTKVKTTETKAATVDVIRNIADYITTIKVGTANDGIYTEPVQIKDLKVY